MKANILLVEDDPDLRFCLAEVLVGEGYGVQVAESGEEAISFVDGGREFDLILSDHYMRNGSGIELLRHVRKTHPHRPVFFLLTGQSEMSAGDAQGLGAQEFILKPFDIPELFLLIERHVAGVIQPIENTAINGRSPLASNSSNL